MIDSHLAEPPGEVVQNLTWGLLKIVHNTHAPPRVWSTLIWRVSARTESLLAIGMIHVVTENRK